jgi:RNA polymerase sigma-70 factor (ECF subfamily)
MKITYEFVTGEVSGVEVDERLGGMLLDLDRQQENNDQKETRRHFSLDSMDYEGELFASAEDTEGEAACREDMARLYSAMEALSPSQIVGAGGGGGALHDLRGQ